MMGPRRRKKAKPLKFGQDYFDSKRIWFKRTFLVKSPVERSGMLAKHYRKLVLTENALENIKGWLQKQDAVIKAIINARKQFKQTKDLAEAVNFQKVQRKAEEAKRLYNGLLSDADRIFSNAYVKQITDGSISIVTEQQKRIHECVHLLRDVKELEKNLLLFSRNK